MCFESVATPCNQDYDESFRQLINAKNEALLDLPMDDFTPFTEEEVNEVVQTLKLDKAAGPDSRTPGLWRSTVGSASCASLQCHCSLWPYFPSFPAETGYPNHKRLQQGPFQSLKL